MNAFFAFVLLTYGLGTIKCSMEPVFSMEDVDPVSHDLCPDHLARCVNGTCASNKLPCHSSNDCHRLTPLKCSLEERCIKDLEQCNGICDCFNCTDEEPHFCAPGDDVIMERRLVPSSTLLLIACGFILWTVYMYFKRRLIRMRGNTFQHDDGLVSSADSGLLCRQHSIAAQRQLARHFTTVSIEPDSENTADNTGPRSFVYDAPPSYVDAINVPQDQNVARPQGSMPPPPSYDVATSQSAERS